MLAVLLPNTNSGWHIVGLPLFEIVCAALIASAVAGSSLTGALSWRPLVFLGKISYSLYLWHFMILWAFGWTHPLMALPVALACAWLSYCFVERPFRRRRVTRMTEPVGAPVAV
jgi:peptidoglycan/LPS O-acetylase OafA/YrhL